MVNLKNVISLSLVLSIALSASQAEGVKRSWQEAIDYENYEAATAAAREPHFFDPDEAGEESSETYEELGAPSPQGTIPTSSLPGYDEWCGSDAHLKLIVDEKRERSLTGYRSLWIAQDQESEAYRSEQARLAAENQAQTQATTQNLEPQQSDYFNDRDLIDAFVEQYLAREWDANPRPPVWPVMDPSKISEDSDADNVSKLVLPKIEPETVPGDSSANPSSRSPSSDFKDGDETDSARENRNPAQPTKGKRYGSLKLEASDEFVKAYEKLSATFSGGELNRAIMKELDLDRATLLLLLDKARYDVPEVFKTVKRARR